VPIKISCSFDLPSSHVIVEVGFRGENKLEPELPFSRNDFLVPGTNLEVIQDQSGYQAHQSPPAAARTLAGSRLCARRYAA